MPARQPSVNGQGAVSRASWTQLLAAVRAMTATRAERGRTVKGGWVAFEVKEVREDGRVVFVVSGEIDLATAGDLRQVLLDAVDSRPLWVDLTEVEFMDSTGLNALVVAHHASDGSLVVVCPEG